LAWLPTNAIAAASLLMAGAGARLSRLNCCRRLGVSRLVSPQELVGTARLIVGDTIDLCAELDCTRIRLRRIDTQVG